LTSLRVAMLTQATRVYAVAPASSNPGARIVRHRSRAAFDAEDPRDGAEVEVPRRIECERPNILAGVGDRGRRAAPLDPDDPALGRGVEAARRCQHDAEGLDDPRDERVTARARIDSDQARLPALGDEDRAARLEERLGGSGEHDRRAARRQDRDCAEPDAPPADLGGKAPKTRSGEDKTGPVPVAAPSSSRCSHAPASKRRRQRYAGRARAADAHHRRPRTTGHEAGARRGQRHPGALCRRGGAAGDYGKCSEDDPGPDPHIRSSTPAVGWRFQAPG
jgi:hypothetical protein